MVEEKEEGGGGGGEACKLHSSSEVEIERWIWSCAGKRAESLGKEKNPESGAERSRREKQVVVATPVVVVAVGALMHLCIHISALETSRKKSSSSRGAQAATTRRGGRRRRLRR